MASFGLATVSGTVTSYLPLTTAWSAPAECSTLWLNPWSAVTHLLFAYDPRYPDVASGVPTCMPPEAYEWWYQTGATRTSLGGYTFNCPEEYATVYSVAGNAFTTTIGCCPSGYNFAALQPVPLPSQCWSASAAGTVTYIQPNADSIFTTTSTYISTSSTVWAVQFNGFIFAGAPATTTSSATTSTTTSGTTSSTTKTSNSVSSGTGGSTTTSSSVAVIPNVPNTASGPGQSSSTLSSISTTSPPASGLNQGAKIGIRIGVSLAFIGLVSLLVAVFLLRRRKPQIQSEDTYQLDQQMYQGDSNSRIVQEVQVQPMFEMNSHIPHYEMSASRLEGPPTLEMR